MSEAKCLYKVSFVNQGQVYEVFARQVYQAELYGFIVIEELVFGERTTVVVDPAEERLQTEFEGVKRSFVPMHAVIRIDEVEKKGQARISDLGDRVTAFPGPVYTPGGRSS
ncbi:MAG TPA: DUF1820 family protein [Phycisphaerales bacterium]|nr:DUF1820 family protein [Phycisphaerales bacterium]